MSIMSSEDQINQALISALSVRKIKTYTTELVVSPTSSGAATSTGATVYPTTQDTKSTLA